MVSPKVLFAAAGFGHISIWKSILVIAAGAVGVALSLVRVTGLVGVGLAGLALSLAGCVEALVILAQRREATLVASLPEVAEAISSGVASGLNLPDCLEELAKQGPKSLGKSFTEFNEQQARGYTLEQSLVWLKVEFSNVYADQLVQLLLVSLRIGGSGLVGNLNRLANDIRQQGALDAELKAKQGWVSGTAKLGLVAPWLIVCFLNQRPEAHAFYSSMAGLNLLLIGQLICLGAYALIHLLSGLPSSKRVFIDAV